MEEEIRKEYIKDSQKDYSMCFKLGVVQEVERGQLSVNGAQHKLPRLGTRKLYYLLKDRLKALGVGRNRLFSILKASRCSGDLLSPIFTLLNIDSFSNNK